MPLLQRVIYSLLATLLIQSSAIGQSNKTIHRVITQQDGLLLDAVNTMAFDDEGFLWLGGLNLDIRTIVLSEKKTAIQRFNGSSFHTIPLPDYEDPILGVEQIYKRSDGKFYIIAKAKKHMLLLFDPISTEFQKFEIKGSFEVGFSLSNVFNHKGKEYIFSQIGREITINTIRNDLTLVPLFSFTTDENKFLVGGSTQFIALEDYVIVGDDNFPIMIFDWTGTLLKKYSSKSFARNRVANLDKFYIDEVFFEDDVCYAFIYNRSQLFYFDTLEKEFLPTASPQSKLENKALKVFTDPLGNSIIGATNEKGLSFNILDEGRIRTTFQKQILEDSGGLSIISNNLNEDLWLGTSNGELHYFKFPSKKIDNYLSTVQMRVIKPLDEKNYLIATESEGWYTLNFEEKTTSQYVLKENGKEIIPSSSRNIFREGDTLWSHSGGNILKIDIETQEAQAFRHYPVICMERPTDTTLVYGTNGYHLMEFNTQDKQHRPLLKTDSLFIYDIAIKDQLVVGATDKGLLTYHLETKAYQLFQKSSTLEDPFLLMVDYHPVHKFILGSRSGKVLTFNAENNTFATVYEDDLNAGIATVLFDDEIWWINTFNGYVAFDPRNQSKTRFSEKDGFSHNEANRYSAFDTGEGFFVGTVKGLNFFKPEELRPEENNSTLRLLKVRSYNSKREKVLDVFDRTILATQKEIILPTEYKELQIDFALDQNVENKEHSFRYRMNDENWTDIKQEQSIRFPNLAAGKYSLEIEASDFSGNKIGDSLLLAIDSKSFFYKTWWFYLLLSLGLVGLTLYFLKQAQDKRKLQENFSEQLLLSQEQERTRIAKDLHDSVGQQLTLIKRKAQENTDGDIAKMTHSALEEVRSISRNLYPTVLKQLGLSESIEQMVYDLDEQTDIFFTAEVDEIDSYFSEEASLNFYRFIQESVTNVLKHAQATSVSIRVKKEGEKIQVAIEDNGKGFVVTENLRNKSLGLKTIAERVRILKGTLQINSKENKGTQIVSEIPIV